ncbi:MAG: peptidyl-tRNA hydrolase Pth2 [Candidatus Micrarchaeota archaeon]
MYKQVIVVRIDLAMGKGKLAAQCSHASLSSYQKTLEKNKNVAQRWIAEGQKKIVLKVEDEKELLDYFDQAKTAGIPCELIQDAGHTQVEPGTVTCLGVGPWDEKELDRIFGKLKLL